MTTSIFRNSLSLPRISVSSILSRGWAAVCLWRERARQRAQLGEMSAEMLKDIGLSTSAAQAEASKPFWIH